MKKQKNKMEAPETLGQSGSSALPVEELTLADLMPVGPGEFKIVPIGQVARRPDNPRKTFNGIEEIGKSIKEIGIQQPLIVRPIAPSADPDGADLAFELVAGERRHRGAEWAGLTDVPVIIRNLTDRQVSIIQNVENLQREGLAPLEEAQSYRNLLDQGCTMADLEHQFGKKRTQLYAKLALLTATPDVRKALAEDKITASIAEIIGRLPGEALQKQALEKIMDEGDTFDGYVPISYRSASRILQAHFTVDLNKAGFSLEVVYEGEHVLPFACRACPHRSGNARDRFPDIDSDMVCTVPACFKGKVAAHAAQEFVQRTEKGERVLTPEESAELFYEERGTLKHESGYVAWDETCYQVEGYKPYKKLLSNVAKPTYAVNPFGDTVALFPRKELDAAFKSAGVKVRSSSGGGGQSADQKKQIALGKLRMEVAKAAVPQILAIGVADVGGRFQDTFWPLLLRGAYGCTSIDTHAFVAKRRGIARTQGEARDALEKLIEQVKSDREESAKLLLELLVCGGPVNVHSASRQFEEDFAEAADLAKVSLADLEKQLKADKPEKGSQGSTESRPTAKGKGNVRTAEAQLRPTSKAKTKGKAKPVKAGRPAKKKGGK